MAGTPAAAAPFTLEPSQPFASDSFEVKGKGRPTDLSQGGSGSAIKKLVKWPTAGVGEVNIGPDAQTKAGALPIWIGPGSAPNAGARSGTTATAGGKVKVEILGKEKTPDRFKDAVVFRITPDANGSGQVKVGVDYAGFSSAFGGDWAGRLRLTALPECALSTPDKAECQATQVQSNNDLKGMRVSAEVDLSVKSSAGPELAGLGTAAGSGMLMSMSAGSSSETGDYGATSLQPSSTWAAGGSSGDFSWNYPVNVPPSLGGPSPTIALAYSSSAVDGKSKATNNQPSWVGQGFEYSPGYIERRYTSCAEDMDSPGHNNTVKTGDLCWGTDNAVMNLNGRGGELVKDDTTGVWKPSSDDGSRIERLDDTAVAGDNTVNGARNNEYWRVTTADGWQYYFGLNRLKGYTGTAPANAVTNSTWTVPVAGNSTNDPCRATLFKDSFCTQAWRWNLDYVVDPSGNTMSYWYTKHTNKYAKNLVAADDTEYVRGGKLDKVAYGTDNRTGTDTIYTTVKAPMQVLFESADRCITAACATHDEVNWPDTPYDQECTAASCDGKYTPVFFSTVRLKKITTQVVKAGAHSDVDSWAFTHQFPPTGSGTPRGLWLESIVRTGHVGTAIALPEVNFDWVAMENRVDTYSGTKPTMNWHRMSTIWTETGGKISVRYSDKECSASNLPASAHLNTKRCYPVLFEEDSVTKTEYFHKYVVTEVTEADLTGGGVDRVTKYEYPGTPAWRFTDDDGISKDKFRTWSGFRGYDRVLTKVGATGQETLTEKRYLRGMHGSKDTPAGTLKTVSSTASIGAAINDEDAFAGMERESIIYNGAETAPIAKTVNIPWQSDPPSATRDMGDTNSYSRYSGVATTYSSVELNDSRGWRTTKSHTTFDTYGMVDQTTDFGLVSANGATDVTGDETCTDNTYVRNTGLNIISVVGRVETFALPCGTNPTSKNQVISDVRNAYDTLAFGAQPTKGLLTQVDTLKDWVSGTGTSWLTSSRHSYDAYGRPFEAWDVRGNRTTTTYEPAASAPVTKVTTVVPVLGTSFVEMEPGWGVPTASVDINVKRTDIEYDALGRLAKVWMPNHTKASFPANPSIQHSYLIRNSGGPNAVTSAKLNAAGNYIASISLYDGLLRTRQTQAPAAGGGGTVFTETIYDKAGRPAIANSNFYDPAVTPSATLRTVLDWENRSQTVTEYDRAGRAVASILKSSGQEKWRTTTAFGGDRVYTTPPQGGTPSTTVTDAKGRTVQLWQHEGSVAGPADITKYTYNAKNLLERVEDSAGNKWINGYDMMGRQLTADDPDKGLTTSTFNDYGDVTQTLDDRGKKLVYEYDAIGRKIGLYENSILAANKRATWVYDPIGAKGKLSSSSRWVGADEYKVKIRGYTPIYQPTGEDYTIPAADAGGVATIYTFSRTYKVDGSPATIVYPNAGGLGGETVTYTYDPVTGLPEQLQTNWPGAGQYVTDTAYSAYGELSFLQYEQAGGNWLQRSFVYDDATRQLKQDTTIRLIAPQIISDIHVEHDKAGNITEIRDTPAGGTSDIQCFDTDHLRRLQEAWTPSSGNCASLPSTVADLGGASPYWHSWDIDKTGNRTKQVLHKSGGDSESTYVYPAAQSDRPHAATSVTTTGPGAGVKRYEFDAIGNMTCRPKPGATTNDCVAAGKPGSQVLSWDPEGRLASLADGSTTHTYVYTADGVRLVARDGTGTTIYLPGQEIRRTTGGAVSSARYYTHAGQVCAVRTNVSVSWLVNDHQGTQSISVAAGNQAVTQRRLAPYGASRDGTTPSWPNGKGFVGGDLDPTGLTQVGARQYDAEGGRFISVDPLIDFTDPQQMNAYAYSNNSPITMSDPDGQMLLADGGGGGGGGDTSYEDTKKRFFEDGPPAGYKRKTYQGPINPGNGIIVTKLFIHEQCVGGPPGFSGTCMAGYGDDRDFSTDPKAGFRVAIAWNTDTGEVVIEAQQSCGSWLFGGCTEAREFDTGEGTFGGGGNNFTVTDNGNGGINIELHAQDAVTWLIPAINHTLTITPGGGDGGKSTDTVVSVDGDPYPDVEVVQYRQGEGAQFLVKSPHARGGSMQNLSPFAPDRHEQWVNGERVQGDNGQSFFSCAIRGPVCWFDWNI